MNSLTPFPIMGPTKGFQTNKKPVFLPDKAWSKLENAYTWRERELKREGNQILGRLQRNLTSQSLGSTVLNTTTYTYNDIFTTLSLRATQPDAEIKPDTLVITIGAPDAATFTDQGDGTFAVTGVGVAAGSYVNYATGKVVIVVSASAGGAAITANLGYYPSLPVMGIWQRELSPVEETQTIFWDTKYAYDYSGTAFEEFISGTTWTGTDYNFFWAYNYQSVSGSRILFVTNNNYVSNLSYDPMYYTDGSTWTSFTPSLTSTTSMFQALILIPYYGRLIALNTWEGASDAMTTATNFYNRCRFSQIGDPTTATAWRSDQFGKGGYLDAPTGESIRACSFIKNTLIVDFDYSTWQLRYVGEYGLPFIWERISTDYGSGSAFSAINFDNDRLTIGDVAITRGNAVSVTRIDLDIPDQVFNIQNQQVNQGAQRVVGVRDFQRELIFWCYADAQSQSATGTFITFPDKVFVYNYRNESWAIFRDNVTFFGTFQLPSGVTWNSEEVTWDDEVITWDDDNDQEGFPAIVKGNQQGWIHLFGTKTLDDASLSVTGVSTSSSILRLTIPNHNLFNAESIYVEGLQFISSSTFLPVATDLNDEIYNVQVVDEDTVALSKWNFTTQSYEQNFSYTPNLATSTYVGGGKVTLFPKLNIITKDINLFQQNGLQTKLSRIDFLLEPQWGNAAVTINLLLNASPAISANILITPKNLVHTTNPSLVDNGSEYLWFSYYQTLSAQYFRIQITYDDDLMNTLTTHQTDFTLYAINSFTRPGGRFASGR